MWYATDLVLKSAHSGDALCFLKRMDVNVTLHDQIYEFLMDVLENLTVDL
jgi:hypothetical protein